MSLWNSSRNSRRSDFADREYRANNAPLTVSGRFVSAKMCESRFVKYGASRRRSSSVNRSAEAAVGSTREILHLNPARDAWMAIQDVEMALNPRYDSEM